MVGTLEKQRTPMTILEKVFVSLLLAIFAGIVLHAPLSVGLGTLAPDYSLLIKSWKEILIIIAAVLALIILRDKKQMNIIKEPLMIGIGIYLATYALSLLLFGGNATSVAAGLAIDLRYIIYFVLIIIAIRLYPTKKQLFTNVGIAGAVIVTVFAILQITVLPTDVLKYIGYTTDTISPFLTVDQNADFIRINSTLRGPNPLGAYAVMVIAGVIAYILRRKLVRLHPKAQVITAIIAVGSLVCLWASYSRSAWIAMVITVVLIVATVYSKRITKRMWLAGVGVLVVLVTTVIIGQSNSFISNVILHENIDGDSSLNSNEGHVTSLVDGIWRLGVQPFGAGVGSTGSASLHTDTPLIIENQYLFIAHETGWLGLAFFVMVFIGVLARLWRRRSDWLALSVFASGVGLAVIGLFLPVWVDDTVAIIWWGLAALAIGGRHD